jgi:hypothetical protein
MPEMSKLSKKTLARFLSIYLCITCKVGKSSDKAFFRWKTRVMNWMVDNKVFIICLKPWALEDEIPIFHWRRACHWKYKIKYRLRCDILIKQKTDFCYLKKINFFLLLIKPFLILILIFKNIKNKKLFKKLSRFFIGEIFAGGPSITCVRV